MAALGWIAWSWYDRKTQRPLHAVIEPAVAREPAALDLTLIAHDVAGAKALNTSDGLERRTVPVGVTVDRSLDLAGGGRYDVAFTMPAAPVRLGRTSPRGTTR